MSGFSGVCGIVRHLTGVDDVESENFGIRGSCMEGAKLKSETSNALKEKTEGALTEAGLRKEHE